MAKILGCPIFLAICSKIRVSVLPRTMIGLRTYTPVRSMFCTSGFPGRLSCLPQQSKLLQAKSCRSHPMRLANSEAGGSKSDPRQKSRRNRILAYAGGFVLIHLTVVFARRYSKSAEKKEGSSVDPPETDFQEYKDPDFKNPMYYYKGYLLPFFAKESVGDVDKFKVNKEDVFVASFPKSGTTWLQEIIYLIERGTDVKLNPEENIEHRFPYLEFIYPGIKEISKREGQRLLKTHLPLSVLPNETRAGKGKVIYIARNPKDVSVSYYYYLRMLSQAAYDGTFEEFFDKFVDDKVAYGPWWKHVLEYWSHRNDDNIMFLTYEELQQDLTGNIEKLAKFLGNDLTSAQVAAIADRCSFRAMKENPTTNYSWWDELGLRRKGEAHFMRKGIVGDWKNHCSTEMADKMEDICKKKLEPAGLKLVDSVN